MSMDLVAVVGHAPAWNDPWSRAQRLQVVRGEREYDRMLFDELGRYVDDRDGNRTEIDPVVAIGLERSSAPAWHTEVSGLSTKRAAS